jgi:hypothetical protein
MEEKSAMAADLKTFLIQLHKNLNVLRQREAKYAGNIPLELLNQIFLDYATERIFLRKVGGGYIFIHRMPLEYFAGLEAGE